MAATGNRACICVLGDIGHSPRMQYHSLSLAAAGYQLDIVAYQESRPHQKLVSNPQIEIHRLDSSSSKWIMNHLPQLLAYALKAFLQSMILFWTLMTISRPDFILVQNPPSVPALPIVWLASRFRRCRFIVDWHNYGYTILALALQLEHPLVRLYRWIEFSFGARADEHFCVSNAMKQDLKHQIGKDAVVLYDRPYGEIFDHQSSVEDVHELFVRLRDELVDHCDDQQDGGDKNLTLITEYDEKSNQYRLRKDRPAILISSTSWTEDEDFQLLLDALQEFDQRHAANVIRNGQPLKLLCFITGKGPLKSHYVNQVRHHCRFTHIRFGFPWLTAEDYPRLMGAADLGVCLHKSSSGLDLPMKILDMFGCRVPVLAYRYASIGELVQHGQNGYLFGTRDELVRCLCQALDQFPAGSRLSAMQTAIATTFGQNDNWNQNWQSHALPVFRRLR